MNEPYPGSSWGDEDVPVPLHQVLQEDLPETPVPLEARETRGAEASVVSGRDPIVPDDADPAAIGLTRAGDSSAASPAPADPQPEPALGEPSGTHAPPRWLYGAAALLLAALCVLSFALGWQRGAVVAAEASPQGAVWPSHASPLLSPGREALTGMRIPEALGLAVIWDTHPQTRTGYG